MSLLLLAGSSSPNVRSLFANGEVGLGIDVQEAYLRGWVYQDSAGATVAAAAGDPVGLILDTAKGGLDRLGGDLITNGTFAADSDWTKGANWTIGSGVATKTGGAANNLTQTISSTAGLWYRITMDVTRTAGTLTVSLGTSGTTYAMSASGSYTFYILAGSSTQTLTLAGDSSFAGTVDNVTAKLVPGNHAYQTTSGSRPLLARTPDGGRRNLLTYSEQLDNAAWTKTSCIVSAEVATSPMASSGTADKIVEAAATSAHALAQSVSCVISTQYNYSLWAKRDGRDLQIVLSSLFISSGYANFDLQNGVVGDKSAGVTSAITDGGNGWYLCSVTFTSIGTASGNININTVTGPTAARSESYAGNGTSGVIVDRVQFEVGSSRSAYQKVGLTSDVTESGKRDCWGLLFDGSDDSLATSSIDFSATDKMTVMAGVRKLSDAARGTVCELTATIASNNGGFHLTAPNAASDTFAFESKGTSLTDAVASSIAAPATRVLTGIGNIAGDSTSLRVNGAVSDTDTGDQGTGNYANAVLYIGRRGGSTLPFNGILYTLIVRGATTTTGTIADFEKNLLARRCGVSF
jgi:hypothetical protein